MNKSFDFSEVLKKALKLRKRYGYELNESICIFELAEKIGLEVRFVEMTSMEGSILTQSKTILISTFRPEGRMRYTCAHEIGHYIFQHGDHLIDLVDKANSGENSIKEKICDLFSSFLLMPETTVRSGFHQRGWDYSNPSAEQVFAIAGWLGVGYVTLLNQMHYTMSLIGLSEFEKLKKQKLIKIKKSILGHELKNGLYCVDDNWIGRPLELVNGDCIICENAIICDSDYLKTDSSSEQNIFEAINVGETNIILENGNELRVRVRRKDYTGRSKFRYLKE